MPGGASVRPITPAVRSAADHNLRAPTVPEWNPPPAPDGEVLLLVRDSRGALSVVYGRGPNKYSDGKHSRDESYEESWYFEDAGDQVIGWVHYPEP